MTWQCNVINLNLTNASTLLSKKLHLASQPAEEPDTDDEADLKSTSKPSFSSAKAPLPVPAATTTTTTTGLVNNFQNTLRTYCLSDCDYLSRQKRQRLKNFNAKIRRSIKAQVKRRQKDSKLLQRLDQEESSNEHEGEGKQEAPAVGGLEKAQTTLVRESKQTLVQSQRSKSEVVVVSEGGFRPTAFASPYSEQFKPIMVAETARPEILNGKSNE
jgi:hypothetical protein